MEETLEAMMRAYAAGDPVAFTRLFERTRGGVYSFFLRSMRDPRAAEDLMQTTFLKLHAARASYDRSLPLLPWLFAIANRVRLDEFRRRHRLPPQAGEEALEQLEVHDDPTDRIQHAEQVRSVDTALDTLPETQRVVLQLRHVEGMTFAQIAQVLQVPEGALRVRATRGYERLRALLHERGADVA
jgi:RNA polymerase sigma-70 factor (ECF subfamily)